MMPWGLIFLAQFLPFPGSVAPVGGGGGGCTSPCISHTFKAGDGNQTSSAIDTTTANFLILCITTFGTGANTGNFSDSKSNTWFESVFGNNGGTGVAACFWAVPPDSMHKSASHTVSWISGAGSYQVMFFAAFTATYNDLGLWSGMTTYSIFDYAQDGFDSVTYVSKINSNTGNTPHSSPTDWQTFQIGNGNSSTSTIQAGSLTPVANNSIIFSFAAQGGANGETYSVDSGFTIIDQQGGVNSVNVGGALAFATQSTAAAVNPQWTIAGGPGSMGAVNIFFKQ